MEPVMEKKISKEDSKRVELFKELITVSIDAASLRQALTRVYINYTRQIISTGDNNTGNDSELYALSELIEILEGGYSD